MLQDNETGLLNEDANTDGILYLHVESCKSQQEQIKYVGEAWDKLKLANRRPVTNYFNITYQHPADSATLFSKLNYIFFKLICLHFCPGVQIVLCLLFKTIYLCILYT